MAQFSIGYGTREVVFSIPDQYAVSTIHANAVEPITNFHESILNALHNPINSKPFHELFHPGEKIVIIVSDITRLAYRSCEYLPILLDELTALGISDKDISIVMSTGDHRKQSVAEHRLIVGETVLQRVKIYDHDCHASDLVPLSSTTRGTTVAMNRMVYEADRVILTGGISYHMIAGFGGGRKSICPGVCGERTIQENHGLALKARPSEICTGNMETNPVSNDMKEVAQMINPDFLLNVIVDEHKQFIGIVAGDWHEAFVAGTKIVEKAFGVPVASKADLVIASSGGFPKDIQLYQSVKALDNADFATVEGGNIILVSECSDGPGPESFLQWFKYKEYAEMKQALTLTFTMPGFVALRTAEILQTKRIYLVSGLDDELVKKVGMIPVKTVSEAFESILSGGGKLRTINIMPYASMTLPILANCQAFDKKGLDVKWQV